MRLVNLSSVPLFKPLSEERRSHRTTHRTQAIEGRSIAPRRTRNDGERSRPAKESEVSISFQALFSVGLRAIAMEGRAMAANTAHRANHTLSLTSAQASIPPP